MTKNNKEIIFTGQEAINDKVKCFCGKHYIHLRYDAWFDPYRGRNGEYVHKDCLSEKRKKEIQNNEKI